MQNAVSLTSDALRGARGRKSKFEVGRWMLSVRHFLQSLIQRAFDPNSRSVQHMRVNHRGANVFVAQEFLHRANVVTTLKQVRGKRVTQTMAVEMREKRIAMPTGAARELHSACLPRHPAVAYLFLVMPELRYHHIGIPTNRPLPAEDYSQKYKLYASGYFQSPYGVEWMKFDPDCPLPELVKTVPHVAFVVDDIQAAIAGKQILIEPNSPAEGVTVAFIVDNGAPVEFLQFDRLEAQIWPNDAKFSR